jgi:type II secretory pathway pseudopilin PulG
MPTPHKSQLHAFTLIETLAVVMLIGLAAIVMTPMLAGATDSTRLNDAVRRFLDLDTRARLLAHQESGLMLRIEDEACVVVVDAESDVQESTPIVQWAHGTQIQLKIETADGRTVDSIMYDRGGRSVDFDVVITAGELRSSLSVAGLTGWVEEKRGEQETRR